MKKINVLIVLGGLLSIGSIDCMEDYVDHSVAFYNSLKLKDKADEDLIKECTEVVTADLNSKQDCADALKASALQVIVDADFPTKLVFGSLLNFQKPNAEILNFDDNGGLDENDLSLEDLHCPPMLQQVNPAEPQVNPAEPQVNPAAPRVPRTNVQRQTAAVRRALNRKIKGIVSDPSYSERRKIRKLGKLKNNVRKITT